TKLEYSRIAHAFLGETFTLAELRRVHEAVLQRPLDPANFRRQVEASGTLVATDHVVTGGRHRPPRLYRYNQAVELVDNGPLSHHQPLDHHRALSGTDALSGRKAGSTHAVS
ncbi:NrtR DNA-binding winged helix domain-containing protein, partial [Salinibacterium sp.]|uniref:NrtR DNA-binding winged helix domain-containing protein n=1 Tax=Salinibacterium sp. TaxID=1915057 RepID=UPI0037C52219